MRISDWSSDVCSSDLAETAAGQICTGPARHQPRTSAEVQRENERDVGIAEAVAGEIGRYAKSGVGRRHELVEHYATPGHTFGTLRHWRPFRSDEHTSELQSLMRLSYAVFFLQKQQHTHKYTKHNSLN